METFTKADVEKAAVKAAELTGAKLLREFAKEEGNPVSAKCERVLEQLEAGKIPCWDFRGTRRAAACAAWAGMEERHIPWGEAIKEGWNKVRAKCTWAE